MELKTKLAAQAGRQDLTMTREFDLPLDLLFKAYTEPELLAQWMGATVLQLENKRHGSYQFETRDTKGNVVFRANGVAHEFEPGRKITRTFEMENAPFPVQLEFLEFESLGADKSRLTMHIVYKSIEHRDMMLKMPFAQGLSMAHDRLQEAANKLLHAQLAAQ